MHGAAQIPPQEVRMPPLPLPLAASQPTTRETAFPAPVSPTTPSQVAQQMHHVLSDLQVRSLSGVHVLCASLIAGNGEGAYCRSAVDSGQLGCCAGESLRRGALAEMLWRWCAHHMRRWSLSA